MFETLLVGLVFAAAPLGSSFAPESGEEQDARYASIVHDAVEVSREGKPLPGLTHRQTAVVLLAVAHRETAFARDADLGPCAATDKGRCDGGRAVCVMQIQPLTLEERREIESDRKACFRAGLVLLRIGWDRCPIGDAYAVFAGGTCTAPKAIKSGRHIKGFVKRWLANAEGRTNER